jgi:hypothetical protein
VSESCFRPLKDDDWELTGRNGLSGVSLSEDLLGVVDHVGLLDERVLGGIERSSREKRPTANRTRAIITARSSVTIPEFHEVYDVGSRLRVEVGEVTEKGESKMSVQVRNHPLLKTE